jgi:hypothetical protein
LTGTWTACGTDLCVAGVTLDLGPAAIQAQHAAADFDGDGTVETNADEFAGLVGQDVTLRVVRSGGTAVVYVIGGHGFRNADGTFS